MGTENFPGAHENVWPCQYALGCICLSCLCSPEAYSATARHRHNSPDHFQREAAAILNTPTILVITLVGLWLEELVKQVSLQCNCAVLVVKSK